MCNFLVVMMFVRFLFLILVLVVVVGDAKTHRILLDTDVDTDDFFAILYLLKQNRSVIDLKVLFCFLLYCCLLLYCCFQVNTVVLVLEFHSLLS